MTTADLIQALTHGLEPTPRARARRRLAMAVAAGSMAAAALLLVWLGTRDLGEAVATGAFWMKAAYTGGLAVAGLCLAGRLARPGRDARAAWVATVVIVATIALAGAAQVLATPADDRLALWLGMTWSRCPLRILALAVPVFVGLLWAMRRLAPTRPAIAGAAAGLAAGAIGATIYGLHCPETAVAFVATWYTLGIALCGAAGALIGSRLLRW